MIRPAILTSEFLDKPKQPRVAAGLVQRRMKHAVQLFETFRIPLDLDLLLHVPRLKKVSVFEARHRKRQRFAFDQGAHREEVATALRGASDDLDAAISSERDCAGCPQHLDCHTDGLTTDPEPRCQRLLPQDQPGLKPPLADVFLKVTDDCYGQAWIHGSKIPDSSLEIK